jgi:hypothetical protein
VKTEFRSSHEWPSWKPDRTTLEAFLDLCERTWPEALELTFELTRGERTDVAENADEVRQLLGTDGSIEAATAINVKVMGSSDPDGGIRFTWARNYAMLSIAGPDEIATLVLRQRVVQLLDAGSVPFTEPIATPAAADTEYRQRHEWPNWRPDRTVLLALIELGERTFDNPTITFELSRAHRKDEAKDATQARRLLDTEGALAEDNHVSVSIRGSHPSITMLFFYTSTPGATVVVYGRDEGAATTLKDQAEALLEAGAFEPDVAAPSGSTMQFEQKAKPPLGRIRFVGNYAQLGQLLRDLVEQIRRLTGGLSYMSIELTEEGHTVKVRHLDDLNRITDRDIRKLHALTVSLQAKDDGPWLLLSIRTTIAIRNMRSWAMSGSIGGPEEVPLHAIRSATNDLLKDRSRSPSWLTYRALISASFVVDAAAIAVLQLIHHGLLHQIVGFGLFGMMLVLFASPFYLPDVELINPGEKTRWARSSRFILGLLIAWLISSLAIPFVTH